MRSLLSLVASSAVRLFLALLLGAFSTFAQSGVTVSLAPTNVTMAASGSFSSSTAFTAKVTGSTNTAVTWSVKGAPNYGFGGISSAGVYTAPAALPTSVIVTATSVADPTVSVSTTVTVVSPTPIISSVSPKALTLGANSLTVYGLNFSAGAKLALNGTALPTTVVSSTQLTATANVTDVSNPIFTVINVGPVTSLPYALNLPGGAGNSVTGAALGVTLTVTPATATMVVGMMKTFTAQVTGATNPAVVWSVKGNQQYGIGGVNSAPGFYGAPATIPAGGTVTIVATSVQDPTVAPCAVVTIVNATPVITSVAPNPFVNSSMTTGAFKLTINGSAFATGAVVSFNGTALPTTFVTPNQIIATGTAPAASTGVTWSILGANDGSLGTVSAAGLYTAPATAPLSGLVTALATAIADPTKTAKIPIIVQDPALVQAGRFLQQTSFGPTPQSLADVRQQGMAAYLANQFALPESPLPDPKTATINDFISAFFYNSVNGKDQLRQRMIYALSQHFVTSSSKEVYGQVQGPWLQTLSRGAFGNFRQLLWDLTLCPGMAFYLDMGNSTKPTPYSNANENYARELMQLFTIGLYQLNLDGNLQLNPTNNQPIATYDQDTVHQMALAMTGWTYPPPDGSKPTAIVPVCYGIGLMQPLDNFHDMTAKQLVGGTNTPAGQGAVADMNAVIDAVFYHPNVGPFIATRLIRAFVTSNPSTNYIARVATVFNSDTNGVRGNLQAVLTAVLMDPEARNDSPDVTQGHLTSPMLHTFGLMRSLNMPLAPNNTIGSVYAAMGEAPLNAPSVFGHYSPLYQLPGTTVYAPEFQIYGPSEMIARANFIYQLLCNTDLSAFTSISDPTQLVNAVDRTLLLGRMSLPLRQVLTQAAANTADPRTRVLTLLYLTAIDPEYAVQN